MNVKQAHQLGKLRELTECVDSCTSEISCRPHACKPDICKHTNDKSKNPGEKDSSAEEIPAEIEEQIAARGNNSKSLGKQLMCNTTRERKLEQLRQLIGSVDLACADQQLHDLREHYARLQEDYDSKLCEISGLRTDVDCLMREIQEAKKERLVCADQQLHDLREKYALLQEDYDSKLREISGLRTDVDCLKCEIQEAKKERECMEKKLIEKQRLTEDRIIPGTIRLAL